MKPLHQRSNSAAFGVILAILLCTALTPVPHARASMTVGTIDPAHPYAFSNVGGYVNFGTASGGVTVTDTAVTGYAWSANDGWINLAPSQGGVLNNGNGNLSGNAWDETAGWINFAGVFIDAAGLFHGQATGALVNGVNSAINFDCTNCSVVTDWRNLSNRISAGTTQTGGSIAPVFIPPPSQSQPTSPPPTGRVVLTVAQVNAIISLLESFGADPSVVANVRAALTGVSFSGGSTTASGTASACVFTRDLTIGAKGADVICLQGALLAGGYAIPAISNGVAAPGYFGAQTRTAVAAWQKALGIVPPAGYFGLISRSRWNLGGNPLSVTTTTQTTTTTTSTNGTGI